MVTKVLFDKTSLDSFGAAYAAWTKLRQTAVVLPVNTQEMPYSEIEGKTLRLASEEYPLQTNEDIIFLVGFSYPLPIMEQMHKIGMLSVIDHHEESVNAYKGLPWFLSTRSDHASCVQAWQYWNPDYEVPDFLAYLSDYTIGSTNRLEETQIVIDALRKFPMDLVLWHNFCCSPSVVEYCKRLNQHL